MPRFSRFIACLVFLGILLVLSGTATEENAAQSTREENRWDTTSSSGQFRVTVTWQPHPPTAENHYTSADYNYICMDTRARQTIWAHHYKNDWDHIPNDLFVSDEGWTIICSRGSISIPIDHAGHDHGQIDVLEQFSKPKKEKYVRDVMDAPPQWAGESLWYFLEADGKAYFVVRPWWGHHVIIDPEAGKVVPSSHALETAIDKQERAEVMAQLTKGAASFKTWENDCCPPAAVPVCTAAYLAGVLQIGEAIPLLRRLESSTYSRRAGGVPSLEKSANHHDGEINPDETSDFTLRQFAQLSLRRLGQTPDPLPGLALQHEFADYKRDHFFAPATPGVPRAENAGRIEKGLSAEQVVALLGGPDVINNTTWEYDLDTRPAQTLMITWKDYRVESFRSEQPAVWQHPGKREMKMCY